MLADSTLTKLVAQKQQKVVDKEDKCLYNRDKLVTSKNE